MRVMPIHPSLLLLVEVSCIVHSDLGEVSEMAWLHGSWEHTLRRNAAGFTEP